MTVDRVRFVESAISNFQIVPDDFAPETSAFERAYLIKHMTEAHMLFMNKAHKENNREKLGYLLEVILDQETERNYKESENE